MIERKFKETVCTRQEDKEEYLGSEMEEGRLDPVSRLRVRKESAIWFIELESVS